MPHLDNYEKVIAKACDTVRTAFPIADYLDKAWEKAIGHVAAAVLRNAPRDRETPTLIDLGCGPLDKTAVFQTLGFDCWAVDDLSDPWISRLEAAPKIQRFAAEMGVRFHLGNFEHATDIPRNYFDAVTVFDVIEHLHESPRMLLNNAGELLRPGGILCITMPNSVNLRKRLAVLAGRTNYVSIEQFFHGPGMWRGHVREYTLAETRWICEAAGFQILAESTFEQFAYLRLPAWLVPAFLLIGRCFPTLRSGLCVLARKPQHWQSVAELPAAFRAASRKSVPRGVA